MKTDAGEVASSTKGQFQFPVVGSQPSVTTVPGDPAPSADS